jgi:hypothetical protein
MKHAYAKRDSEPRIQSGAFTTFAKYVLPPLILFAPLNLDAKQNNQQNSVSYPKDVKTVIFHKPGCSTDNDPLCIKRKCTIKKDGLKKKALLMECNGTPIKQKTASHKTVSETDKNVLISYNGQKHKQLMECAVSEKTPDEIHLASCSVLQQTPKKDSKPEKIDIGNIVFIGMYILGIIGGIIGGILIAREIKRKDREINRGGLFDGYYPSNRDPNSYESDWKQWPDQNVF